MSKKRFKKFIKKHGHTGVIRSKDFEMFLRSEEIRVLKKIAKQLKKQNKKGRKNGK